MSRHFISRATSLGVLAAALLFASAASQAASQGATQAASGDCDRACLRQTLDAYLAGVFKHDPGAAGLTDDFVATENTVETHKGEGFWKSVSGYGALQRRYLDPVNESAAYFGLLTKDGHDQITSLRVQVQGRKVSEAEWIFGTQGPGGVGEANPAGLVKSPPPNGALPASERTSRFMMISLPNDYFQAVQDHDGSWVPNDPSCVRIENGGGTTTNARPAGAPPAQAYGKVYGQGGCLDNFANFNHLTKDLALRRIPVVDEEAGVALGTAIYVRYPGLPNLANLVHEYFLIRNGKIAGLWTSMYFLPHGTPVTSGWENKQGGVER